MLIKNANILTVFTNLIETGLLVLSIKNKNREFSAIETSAHVNECILTKFCGKLNCSPKIEYDFEDSIKCL